jgi:hypothetical protein
MEQLLADIDTAPCPLGGRLPSTNGPRGWGVIRTRTRTSSPGGFARHHIRYNGSSELAAPQHTAVTRPNAVVAKKRHPSSCHCHCHPITIFRVESNTTTAFIACCGFACCLQPSQLSAPLPNQQPTTKFSREARRATDCLSTACCCLPPNPPFHQQQRNRHWDPKWAGEEPGRPHPGATPRARRDTRKSY